MKKLIIFPILLFFIFGCNKQDSQIIGAGVGAALGADMAGKNDKAVGAAAGALAGYWVGGEVGQAIEDDKEEQQIRRRKYQKIRRYCHSCREWLKIPGAKSCPYCGTGLVVEKYCRHCARIFDPSSSYKYCPKCVGGIRLRYR